MSKSNVTYNGGGISFAGLLTIVFITLKLTGVIAWSWWWVLCPLWIGWAIFLSIMGVLLVFGLIAAVIVLIVDKIKG